MRISEILTRDVEVAGPAETLQDVARRMREVGTDAVCIGEGERIEGIITEHDIVVRAVCEALSVQTPVREVMTPGVETCREDDDVAAVAARMVQLRLRRLAVLDRDGRFRGIVSLGDLARLRRAETPGRAPRRSAGRSATGRPGPATGGRERPGAVRLPGSHGSSRKGAGPVSGSTAAKLAWRIRAATPDQRNPPPVPGGFHLVDTTMWYGPKSGGVKRYLSAKRTFLEKHRPDVRHTLVVPGARTQGSPGLVTMAAARMPFGYGYRMPASPAKWDAALRLLQPDVIEAGDVFVPGHAALDAGEAMGVPVVGFCHTDAAALAALYVGEWAQAPTFTFWAQTYQRFDLVVAPSRHMAARLADAGVQRMAVQQLGVDTELFHPSRGDRARLLQRLDLPAETRLLVFAGRPAREKNVDSMVAAVERLGKPYTLLLVGAGKDVTPTEQVICLDYEPDPVKLAGIVASCDAGLHANENEIFGLVVLEAMASGLPVVGARTGGVGELIDETVGQRADGVDPAGLAAAIEALFARDLGELSRAARQRAETRHGWDAVFANLTRIYGDLVGTGKRRPLAMTA